MIVQRAFTLLLTALFWLPLASQSAYAHPGHEDHDDHRHAEASPRKIMTTREGAKLLPLAKEQDVFHFVIYGDRTGGVPAGLKVLEQAVVDTNLLDPDLVMTVGDLIQGYNEKPEWLREMKEYQAIMGRLKMKWYPVAGNHDIYWRGQGPAPAGQHEKNYEEHFGPLWYSFQHKNAGFIMLYSDEGDPEKNEKGFTKPWLQKMSARQLEFLDKALVDLKDCDQVMVFLHHPRWLGGNYGDSWRVVHEKLKNAGNVSAVFAGHIHHMHYLKPTDGIEYYTLGATGGNISTEIPGAGYLHHLNLVSVRKDKITVSALPVGAVIDPKQFTPEFLAEIGAARRIRPIQTSKELVLKNDGSTAGEVAFTLQNPSDRPIEATFMLDPRAMAGGWRATLDHEHTTLAPGAKQEVRFQMAKLVGPLAGTRLPSIRLQLEYLGEKARVRLPEVVAPLGIRPAPAPEQFFEPGKNRVLRVNSDRAAARVNSSDIDLKKGPFTVEAWVKPDVLSGYRGIIAKTENSEYALFSDEGVPQFDVHVGGRYVTATATDKLRRDKWTHLAGVYNGSQVLLFVDGKQIAAVDAPGDRRTNKLPLFIGADPNGSGQPTRSFSGTLDEVRLTRGAVYDEPFEPARRFAPTKETVLLLHFDNAIGPFVMSHGTATHGQLGSKSRLVEVE